MPTRHDIDSQINALGPHAYTFGARKEVRFLPDVLDDDEPILGLTFGFVDGAHWLIVCTPTRVVLLDDAKVHGLRQRDIALERITAVSYTTGFLNADIAITIDGVVMHLRHIPKEAVKPFVDALDRARDAHIPQQAPPRRSTALAADPVVQTDAFAELKNSGEPTDDVFTLGQHPSRSFDINISGGKIGQVAGRDNNIGHVSIHVDGYDFPLSDIDDDSLEALRVRVRGALRRSRFLVSCVHVTAGGLIVGFWSQLPTILGGRNFGLPADVAGVMLLLSTAIAVWVVMRAHFGEWIAEQRGAQKVHRRQLDAINAEFGLRPGAMRRFINRRRR